MKVYLNIETDDQHIYPTHPVELTDEQERAMVSQLIGASILSGNLGSIEMRLWNSADPDNEDVLVWRVDKTTNLDAYLKANS